jgi:hypothetical protein
MFSRALIPTREGQAFLRGRSILLTANSRGDRPLRCPRLARPGLLGPRSGTPPQQSIATCSLSAFTASPSAITLLPAEAPCLSGLSIGCIDSHAPSCGLGHWAQGGRPRTQETAGSGRHARSVSSAQVDGRLQSRSLIAQRDRGHSSKPRWPRPPAPATQQARPGGQIPGLLQTGDVWSETSALALPVHPPRYAERPRVDEEERDQFTFSV